MNKNDLKFMWDRFVKSSLTELLIGFDNRDTAMEWLWKCFADVPVDEYGYLEDSFFIWMPGTYRETVWWFLQFHHSKGLGYLAFGDEDMYYQEAVDELRGPE